MNLKKYFQTNESELRLVDYISMFYAFLVILYTLDDFKKRYPIYLIAFGLIIHALAFLTWRDEKREESYFGESKQIIYKIVPPGLCVLYISSILVGIERGEIDQSSVYNVVVYLVTIIPMILYFISVGFGRPNFGFLRQRKQGLNVIYLGLVVLMMVGQKIVCGE